MSLYNDLTTVLTPYANKIKRNESDISVIKADLLSDFKLEGKGFYVYPSSAVVQGVYLNDGTIYADRKRISITKIPVYADEIIDITHGTNCANNKYGFFDESGTLTQSSWSSGDKHLTVPYDGHFVCAFATSDYSGVITPEDYDAVITFESKTNDILTDVTTRLTVVENEVLGVVTPDKTSFFEDASHNRIDSSKIQTGFYLSPSLLKIAVSSSSNIYAITGLIPVTEGETYTASGTAFLGIGGYFAEGAVIENNQAALSAVTFFNPVTGSGKCFTVPTGQNIKYVALTLKKDTSTNTIDGTYQMEVGEMATDIVAYSTVWKVKEQYIPDTGQNVETAITTLPDISYDSATKAKISNFVGHWLAKDKDLMVVGTGTSLTARSSEHCTVRDDATSRPPLMHSNNFASKIWDRIKWDGQQYRRFDYTGFFTETGTFASTHDLENWDDNNYRYGLTRYADGGASVQYTIPADAWQANFIYRTDSAGCESATVTVAEGDGIMTVWNGSAWVEANGYTFSMKQEVVELTNVSIHNPNTPNNSTVVTANYQVGGNTTYQKRLKMKAVTRTATKTITISAASGRLLYWGVEWSPREFMITYVNSARGSHNMSYGSTRSLAHFQDNEVWSFNPDLIFTENPIHNSGGAGANIVGYHTTYWGYITNDFFFNTDDPISFVSRATANGIDVSALEWIIFTSSLSWNFGGIDDDGELKLYADADGKVMSALDAQTLTYKWLLDNKTNVVNINACQYWCDAGFKLFGSLKDATVGSGKSGSTFTNEGSHWNNTGCAIMAKCIAPIFDFYY